MDASTEPPADYLAWERARARAEFERVCVRRRLLKTRLDCGHWIDATEPYRYSVWKYRGQDIGQRTDCEFCARVDLSEKVIL